MMDTGDPPLPPEVINHIFSYLSLPSILQLRLVSRRLRTLVDSSLRVSIALQDIQISLNCSKLKRFVETVSSLPFSNFHISNKDKPGEYFYKDTPHLRTFKKTFCPKIRKLHVDLMTSCTSNAEFGFFLNLRNLRDLRITRLVPQHQQPRPKNAERVQRLPFRGVNRILQQISVDQEENCHDYLTKLIQNCPSLQVIGIPESVGPPIVTPVYQTTQAIHGDDICALYILRLAAQDDLQHLQTLNVTPSRFAPECDEAPNSIEKILSQVPNSPLTAKELQTIPINGQDLLGDNWLVGETIDNVILQLIRESQLGNIKLVREVIFMSMQTGRKEQSPNRNTQQTESTKLKYNTSIHYAAKNLLLNCDVLFIPINSDDHWVLGVISYESKAIAIVDNFHTAYQDQKDKFQQLFRDLFMLVLITYLVAGRETSLEEWKFVYGNDAPVQKDESECGVNICLIVLALLNRLKYPLSKTIDSKNQSRNRRWMFQTLVRLYDEPLNKEKNVKKMSYRKFNAIILKLDSLQNLQIPVKVKNSQRVLAPSFCINASGRTICTKWVLHG